MIERVTIIVSPRERFSQAARSLESIFQNTTIPFQLIYIDGNSPKPLKLVLEQQAEEKGFKLVRRDSYLTPNQARNIGIKLARTEYIVFVDNDLVVSPGWLKPMVDCADEEAAAIVTPLLFEGEPEDQIIHMAGGLAHFRTLAGRRRLFEKHRFSHKPLSSVVTDLKREPTELFEFHCALMRSSIFEEFGPLDEGLMSLAEHVDLSLTVRQNGKSIYLEPKATVTYLTPPPFDWSDILFYWIRWSDHWNQASVNHFHDKWELSDNDPFLEGQSIFARHHRRLLFSPILMKYRKLFPKRGGFWIVDLLEKFLNRLVGQQESLSRKSFPA